MGSDERLRQEIRRALKELRWLAIELRQAGVHGWPESRLDRETAVEEPPMPSGGDPRRGLLAVREELGECKRCRLHQSRTHIVFGEGSPQADLVFVGEGPGFEEDRQGRPFVGRAGKLLDKMILALRLQREAVYICNVVKCRPPNNRTPAPDEAAACLPFLIGQIEALRPAVICALGACAAQTLLGSSQAVSALRTKVHQWRGIPLIATYHPAYLLRNPVQKAATWQDLLLVDGLRTSPTRSPSELHPSGTAKPSTPV
jgi:DNA polymerase